MKNTRLTRVFAAIGLVLAAIGSVGVTVYARRSIVQPETIVVPISKDPFIGAIDGFMWSLAYSVAMSPMTYLIVGVVATAMVLSAYQMMRK